MRKPKMKRKSNRMTGEDEFLDQQSGKKIRDWKKIKRDKPPHKKWED